MPQPLRLRPGDPLFLAAMLAWLATLAATLRFVADAQRMPAVACLLAWLAAFVAHGYVRGRPGRGALVAAEVALALGLAWLDPTPGTAQVLLVAVAAQVALGSMALAVALAVACTLALSALLWRAGWTAPWLVAGVNLGFQLFAALCAWYARSAGEARDRLQRVNAGLLATRALLADSARDAERLRVARELHDIAGHKLTALALNLRALADDATCGARPEVATAQRLASELLADIRAVVSALRDPAGLDLGTALRALAAPLPRPALALDLDPALRIRDPALADTVLRVVQEALTNAARHADAGTLAVSLRGGDGCLRLHIEDDGRVAGALREGSGLAGMRERVAEAGGRIALRHAPGHPLAIDVELPL